MFQKKKKTKIPKHLSAAAGFTLLDVMVTISIITFLASNLLVAFRSANLKARDARREADFKQINAAINLYYSQVGFMPKNYNCYNWVTHTSTVCDVSSTGNTGVCDAPVPGMPGADPALLPAIQINNLYRPAWDATMQDMVNAGLLASIPHSAGGPGYCYYDFGHTSPQFAGALLMTEVEYAPPSVMGLPPSCRPWTSVGSTWCEQRNSVEYCMCNAY